MSQNLISLTLDDATLASIDAALDSLETAFIGLIALTPEQRRSLVRMGDKSEAFCRQILVVLAQSLQVLPPSYDLAEAQDDLRASSAVIAAFFVNVGAATACHFTIFADLSRLRGTHAAAPEHAVHHSRVGF